MTELTAEEIRQITKKYPGVMESRSMTKELLQAQLAKCQLHEKEAIEEAYSRGYMDASDKYLALIPQSVAESNKTLVERIELRGETHEINGIKYLCLSPVAMAHLKQEMGI